MATTILVLVCANLLTQGRIHVPKRLHDCNLPLERTCGMSNCLRPCQRPMLLAHLRTSRLPSSIPVPNQVLGPSTCYLVPGTRYQVLGTGYQVPGTGHLVPSTWYQVVCTNYLVPSIWYQVSGTKYLVPGTWYRMVTACGKRQAAVSGKLKTLIWATLRQR